MPEVKIGKVAVYEHLIEQCEYDGAHIEGMYDLYINEVVANEFEIEDAEDEERVEPEDFTYAKKSGQHICKLIG